MPRHISTASGVVVTRRENLFSSMAVKGVVVYRCRGDPIVDFTFRLMWNRATLTSVKVFEFARHNMGILHAMMRLRHAVEWPFVVRPGPYLSS